MGFPAKVQLIKRKQSEQWYLKFPSAVVQAMDFERGEVVEWTIEDKGLLALKRQCVPPSLLKKVTGIEDEFARSERTTTQQMLAMLRAGLWKIAINFNLTHFAAQDHTVLHTFTAFRLPVRYHSSKIKFRQL